MRGNWAISHWLTDAAAAVINSRLFRFRFRFMPVCFPSILGAALLLLRFCGDAEARPLATVAAWQGCICQMPQAH